MKRRIDDTPPQGIRLIDTVKEMHTQVVCSNYMFNLAWKNLGKEGRGDLMQAYLLIACHLGNK